MNRLVDEASHDPLEREVADVVRGLPLPEPPLGVEQRIRAQLFYRQRRATPRLRPAFAGLVLFGSVALAAIAVQHEWHHRHDAAPIEKIVPTPRVAPHPRVTAPVIVPPSPEAVVTATRPPRRHDKMSVAPVEAPVRTAAPLTTAPLADDVAIAPDPVAPSPAAAVVQTTAAAKAADERASAALLVVQAARALRRDHDAKRALPLLEEYLRRYPDGDLAEEALALAMQAKAMRNDAGAATLAKQYLGRFPNGRFHDEAQAAANRFER